MFHDDAAFGEVPVQLAIEFIVAESNGCRFGPTVREDNALDACPVGRRQAHRAWFAGSVERAASEVKVAELVTGGTNGADFGMGGGIATGDDTVPAFGNDPAVAHYHRAEWAAFAGLAAESRQFNGAVQEKIIVVHVLALWVATMQALKGADVMDAIIRPRSGTE